MKKLKDFLGLIRLFFTLVLSMIYHFHNLNDDLENNFMICKKICKRVIKMAKIDLHIYDQESIPADKHFLLVPNHRCFFDVVFLLAAVDRPISFVAARELWSYPILRRYLSSIHCIPLDRYTQNLAKLKSNITQIKEAVSQTNLVMFPESKCSYYQREMNPFKKGGFMGVIGTDIYIVPAYLEIHKIKHLGKKWLIPQEKVSIYVGKAFEIHEISDKRVQASELAVYCQKKVKELQDKAELTQ